MMARLGWKNLLHDKVRALTAVAGVTVSVVLLVLQLGLLEGAFRASSGVIDNSKADVWIVAPNSSTFDFGDAIPERRFYQALGAHGVERAERMALAYGKWKTPEGRQHTVLLVGIEPDARLSGPWGMAEGDVSALRQEGGIIIDERERVRFGAPGRPLLRGDEVEINFRAYRVVGFSRGVGTFTTVPYVFTSLAGARKIADFGPGYVSYVLAKGAAGVPPADLARRLRALPDVEALTALKFRDRTRDYWIFGTGMGLGVLVTACLGLVVGMVIVGQTLYTMTVEKRREYGTLKALGYSAGDLANAVLVQASALGVAGYALGMAVALAVLRYVEVNGVAIHISPELAAGSFGLTLLLCALASISSIARIAGMEPAAVFRQ